MRRALALLAFCLAAAPAAGETLRVAAYNVDLAARGPGMLLKELGGKPKPAALAAVAAIRAARPDVLVLHRFDHDPRGRALDAFAALLAAGEGGIDYPHRFAAPVNAGRPSGLDLDGDTLRMGPGDALGWGRFPGHGGMAILSRLPLDAAGARSFRRFLWRDLPGADLPARPDGSPHFGAAALEVLPLSSRSHWDVAVILPDGGRLHLLTAHPTPPLYDGPERLNRRRNADELRFWAAYLDGTAFADDAGRVAAAPDAPLVLLGDFGLDPFDGSGDGGAIAALLAHPRLTDPRPASAGAAEAAAVQGGANARHRGPPALDTADFRDDRGPGNLRTTYVLPGRGLEVLDAGVLWPAAEDPLAAVLAAGSPHRLVWVDLAPPRLDPTRPGG